MLFIPGFMQRGDAWRPVAELLPERYPSVMLEHEQSSFEGRLGEIAAAGEGRLLVGYSLGGRLALRAALRDPEHYLGVVTIGATAGIDEPSLRSTARRGGRAARRVDGGRADRGHRRRVGAPAAVRRPVRGAGRGSSGRGGSRRTRPRSR